MVGIRRAHATDSVGPTISIGLCRGCCIGQMPAWICDYRISSITNVVAKIIINSKFLILKSKLFALRRKIFRRWENCSKRESKINFKQFLIFDSYIFNLFVSLRNL